MDWNSVLPQIVAGATTLLAAIAGGWVVQRGENKRVQARINAETNERVEARKVNQVESQRNAVREFLVQVRSEQQAFLTLRERFANDDSLLNDYRIAANGLPPMLLRHWEDLDLQLFSPALRDASGKLGSFLRGGVSTVDMLTSSFYPQFESLLAELRAAAAQLNVD